MNKNSELPKCIMQVSIGQFWCRTGDRGCHAKDHKVSQRHTTTFNKICLLVQKKEKLRWELQTLKQ